VIVELCTFEKEMKKTWGNLDNYVYKAAELFFQYVLKKTAVLELGVVT